jgi:aryl-phospho-beta-D-glucosidase BglC (GH1 family)
MRAFSLVWHWADMQEAHARLDVHFATSEGVIGLVRTNIPRWTTPRASANSSDNLDEALQSLFDKLISWYIGFEGPNESSTQCILLTSKRR